MLQSLDHSHATIAFLWLILVNREKVMKVLWHNYNNLLKHLSHGKRVLNYASLGGVVWTNFLKFIHNDLTKRPNEPVAIRKKLYWRSVTCAPFEDQSQITRPGIKCSPFRHGSDRDVRKAKKECKLQIFFCSFSSPPFKRTPGGVTSAVSALTWAMTTAPSSSTSLEASTKTTPK